MDCIKQENNDQLDLSINIQLMDSKDITRTSPSNIYIKQEFDDDVQKDVSMNNSQVQYSVVRCSKVKKDEELSQSLVFRHWSSHSSPNYLQMDRLNYVNIKQEGDEDEKKVLMNNEEKQLDNEESSSRHDNTSSSNIYIKQEFDEDAPQEVSINNAQQQQNSVGQCVKMEKDDESVECKVELNVDECDCFECRSFTGERPYQCPWNGCDKTFDQKCHTLAHLKLHKPELLHICEFCGKRFPKRTKLVHHIRLHTREKPHKCHRNGCGKAFAQKYQLLRHHRLHPPERLFKCDQCGEEYPSELILAQHIRFHTSERLFKCPCNDCNEAFAQKHRVLLHLKLHRQKLLYKCEHCGKGFKRALNLTEHILVHTGVTISLGKIFSQRI